MPKIVASKEDWVILGHKLFSESGESGLNVDRMSRILKCNKSSFYWHFKTKKNFMDCLIDYWIATDTVKIMDKVDKQTSAEGKLLKLIEIAFKKDSNLDFIFYLKKFAQSDKRILKTVDRIDAERIDFVNELLIQIGYSSQEAMLKARIFYKYLIGYHELIRHKKQDKDYLRGVLSEINQFIKIDV